MENEFRGIKSTTDGEQTQTKTQGPWSEIIVCFAAIVSTLSTGKNPMPEPVLRAAFEAGLERAKERPIAVSFPFAPSDVRMLKLTAKGRSRMKELFARLAAAHHARKANRWKERRIHSNRDAYRLGFRQAAKRHV